MKILKTKIVMGIIFLSLIFLFMLSILEQSLSVALLNLVTESVAVGLWIIIPVVMMILTLLIMGSVKDKFIHLVYVTITLLFISNITFLLYINNATTGFGIIVIVLSVWGSTLWFIVGVLIKLLYSYFFKKDIKEVIALLLKVKIIKSILLSVTFTFVLFQLYLMGSSIVAYKTVKVLNLKENIEYSVFSFYRPFNHEIRLSNGMRWSYGRVKFVHDGN